MINQLAFLLFISFTVTSNKTVYAGCTRSKITTSKEISHYTCPDGTVSFVQPDSQSFQINWKKIWSEFKMLRSHGELESFPEQERKSIKPSQSRNTPQIEEEKTFKEKIKIFFDSLKTYKENYKSAEGACGATAASNVTYGLCAQDVVSPQSLMDTLLKDSFPGVFPGTLEQGLNQLFAQSKNCPSGEWKYYYSESYLDFLDSIFHHTQSLTPSWGHDKSPMIVLTGDSEGYLHYVTVVNIKGYTPHNAYYDIRDPRCQVVYNDDQSSKHMQTTISCIKFIQISRAYADNAALKHFLHPYTRLVFKP